MPIRVAPAFVSNWGSIRVTLTDGLAGFELTTHTAPGEVARPVGLPVTGMFRVTVHVAGSTRATVWSPRFATQSESAP